MNRSPKSLTSMKDFLESLDPQQREFFRHHEAHREAQLQSALREATRSLGTLSQLLSDATLSRA